MTLREACQVAGVLKPDYGVVEGDYYFVADDGSVFTMQRPAFFGLIGSPTRTFVAGPRQGQTEKITSADLDAYQKEAEAKYGRYIPGGAFSDPRFEPGTERKTLPIIERGLQRGYVDKEGVHWFGWVRDDMEGA
jgi:hypothetical protein